MVKGWIWWLEKSGWICAGALVLLSVTLLLVPGYAGGLVPQDPSRTPEAESVERFNMLWWVGLVTAFMLGLAIATGWSILDRHIARLKVAQRPVGPWRRAALLASAVVLAAVLGAGLAHALFLPVEKELEQFGSQEIRFLVSTVLGLSLVGFVLLLAASVVAVLVHGLRRWLWNRELGKIRAAVSH